ncbi:MAG: glycosyltransferase [Lachnospiraceae bacterium]|nr:glycosyltransferase [Lachnospiraceae bacterium]
MIKKVLFHIYSLGKGGAERVVTTLAAEMAERGIEVCVATLCVSKEEYPLSGKVRRIDVGLTEEEEKKGRLSRMRTRIGRLKACLVKEKPDVVYAFMQTANYRAILAARGLNIPVIISVRSNPAVDYASKNQKMLADYLYKKAAGAVFQTTGARDFFAKEVADRAAVILNPLNPKYQGIEPPAERRKVFVSVGRFHEAKDYMTLVKAYERVAKEHPEYNLEIYGGASEDNTIHQVREWVRSHHLTEQILFMGDHNDLEKCITDAACYVLSSKYEGMPNALMEAMALGIPVVATDCPSGGPAALIEDGENGLLVEVGNDKEMAAAMCKMLEYPKDAERVSKAARKITEDASVKKIADAWLEYAEKCI